MQDPKVYRVYLSKEILSYIREITKEFKGCLTKRVDYQFNFPSKNKLDAHDMSHLTCAFAAQVTDEGAAFDYSKVDAQKVLKALCGS